MSSNNNKKKLEIKNVSYISTYNLAKNGINKNSLDNKRLLTGIKNEVNKNYNNSNNIRNNSNSTNKNISSQNKKVKKKSLNESPNIRLTSPKFINNFLKSKGSSTPSVSPIMFSLSQTSKNKKNKNNNCGVNLIANIEKKINKTSKNNEKKIIKNIYTSNIDNNFLWSQLNKHCKSVGKDSQNFISKRNYAGLLLNDAGNKLDNNYCRNIDIKKNDNKSSNINSTNNGSVKNNNNNLINNISYSNVTNQNMNTNNSNQSNSNININKKIVEKNNNGNGLFSSTSTNSINNFINKNVNNIKTVNLINNNDSNNKNKINKSNYNIKFGNKRTVKTKSAEQTSHNQKFHKNEMVYNTNYIINFFEQKNDRKTKNKNNGHAPQRRQDNENKNTKNQNKALNVQNKLKNLNSNNSEDISNLNNKEKSYISTTTNNNVSTTAGNIPNNSNVAQKIINNDEINLDELNLEELHFFIVSITQNYKKIEMDF